MKKFVGTAGVSILMLALGVVGCAEKKSDSKASKDETSSKAKDKEKDKAGATASAASTKAEKPGAETKPATSATAEVAAKATASEAVTVAEGVAPPAWSPGTKSDAPTTADWNSVTKEVTVLGSSKLNCETKQLREWVRVSCRGKNDTGGEPTGVRITKGGGRGDEFIFNGDKVASLIYRFMDGASLEAEFKWTDKKMTLVVDWPHGSPEPNAKAVFK